MSLDLDALLNGSANPNEDGSSPFRPSREALVQGVNKTAEFDRILSLARRAEEIDPETVERLTDFLKSDAVKAWDRIRARAWRLVPPEKEGDKPRWIRNETFAENWRVLLPEGSLPDSYWSPEEPWPERVQSLRPIQARALKDALERKGLFAPIGVGHGKFLISVLVCVLVSTSRIVKGKPPGRWLLFVPANLLIQTRIELAKAKRHWRVPGIWPSVSDEGFSIRIESYDKLSSAKSSRFLQTRVEKDGVLVKATEKDGAFFPSDIIADECHKLRRASASRSRKFRRYFEDRPDTNFYAMSGSITKKTIRDYWQLIQLALPDLAPLPRTFPETEAWSQALDDAPNNDLRRAPGALLELCAPKEIEALKPGWSAGSLAQRLGYFGESDEDQRALLEIVRNGYQRRLCETPGVVATSAGSLGTSLVVTERIPPPAPRGIVEAFADLRTTWRTPNGDEIDSPISMWRHSCELGSGFWNRWIPPAPEDWLFARGEWNKFVRYVLTHNRQRLDSPFQVVQAVDAGRVSKIFGPGEELLANWRAVRDSFEPNPVAEWVDKDWIVNDAANWFAEQKDDDGKPVAGIAWVSFTAFGEELAKRTGLPYFGGGPEAGAAIAKHRGSCIASIAAHGVGKNLQWASRNLVVHPPSGGDVWEQLLGRTHRPGQEAEEVRVDFYGHVLELREAFKSAKRSSTYIQDSTNSVQKLSYASVSFRGDDEIEALQEEGDPLWTKGGAVARI